MIIWAYIIIQSRNCAGIFPHINQNKKREKERKGEYRRTIMKRFHIDERTIDKKKYIYMFVEVKKEKKNIFYL